MMYNNTGSTDLSITIRAAAPGDDRALRRLAQRDTQAPPEGNLLVAEVGGELRAAISLDSGEVTADPFHRTQELVQMLTVQRLQCEAARRRRTGGWLRQTGPRPALAP
jgi:hypothetical protein